MRKRFVKILTGLAVVLVALGVVYAVWVGISAGKLRRAQTALRVAGRPLRAIDVIPGDVPDTENAALLYESAILLLRSQAGSENSLLSDLGNLSETFTEESLEADQLAQLQGLLERDAAQQALSIARRGAERAFCRFDLNYDDGINIRLTHLSELRTLGRIVAAQTQLEAQAGRVDEAWEQAVTQLKFADALWAEPVIVSQLVRLACIEEACQMIQKLCALGLPSQQQDNTLGELLAEFDDVAPMVLAIDGDRLLFGDAIFTLRGNEWHQAMAMLTNEDDMPGVVRTFLVRRMGFRPLLLADHATYLQLMRRQAEMMEQPYSPETMTVLQDAIERASEHNLLTRMLCPPFVRVKRLHTERMARIRVTRTGLALLQHQKAHGALPATLGELGFEKIEDPFSEDPLRYRPDGDGFVLYSLGPDQQDNDGSPREEKKQETDYDIVWHFPGPSAG